jgi:hypothetical protein
MKFVPAVKSGGSKAFICHIISDGFMSPIPEIYAARTLWPRDPWCTWTSGAPSAAPTRRRRSRRSPQGCR